MVADSEKIRGVQSGSRAFSQEYREPVRILESQTIWNHTSHVIWRRLPEEPCIRGESLVSDQPDAESGNLVTDQPTGEPAKSVTDQRKPLKSLNETQWQIVDLCDVPRTMADLMAQIGVTHRAFFIRAHHRPMVEGGVLNMKFPETPNHPDQSYVLSEVGVELKARRMEAGDE